MPLSSSATSAARSAQLTISQARLIFAAFLPRYEELPTQPSLAKQITTAPETATSELLKGQGGFAVGALSGDRFVVPLLTSYPRWFAVAGTGETGRGFLFVLVQQSQGAPWRDASEMYDLSTPPQIMSYLSGEGIGASGTATQATGSDDAGLAVPPASLSAAYATYLNDQGKGPDRKDFAAGGYTTDMVTGFQQEAAGALSAGWRFTDRHSPTTLANYGILLSNGAALVVFYVRDTETWTATSASARVSTPSADSGYSPPSSMLADVGVRAVRKGLRLTITAIDENLAVVGPLDVLSGGNVTVIVSDGKATAFSKG